MNGIESLPIYTELERIAEKAACGKILSLSAQPGAGKTTLVPWKLIQAPHFNGKKILLLEPRRIAARAAADRIAFLLGEKPGGRVGLRTRQETITGKDVRLEVVTEAILTRMIQNDPALEEYSAVIFDEFHERSIHADLGFALVMESRAALRPDLSVVVMSATLSTDDIESAYGEMEKMSVPGRSFPVDLRYCPPRAKEQMWDAAYRLGCLAHAEISGGDVLIFLPGFREILRAKELFDASSSGAETVVLHGSLPPEESRRIIAGGDGTRRRVILSTNVAETSLTIPNVRAVVDLGYCRRVRYSPRTGMDHTETARISMSSAEQRRGRAGRLAPGVCYRWWGEHEVLERDTAPEITSGDLAPLVMECALWGTPAHEMKFVTTPPPASCARAEQLLRMLDLLDDNGKITQAGKGVMNMGLHPRLGKMVRDAADIGHGSCGALIAALLEEDDIAPGADADFRDRISLWLSWNKGGYANIRTDRARRAGDEAKRIMRLAGTSFDPSSIDPDMAGAILLHAFPDRAARKTGDGKGGQSRWVLTGGRAAIVRGSLSDGEFLVAPEIEGGLHDAKILLAAPISRTLVESGVAGPITEHREFEWNGWSLRARSVRAVGSLVIRETAAEKPDASEITDAVRERITSEGISCLPWNDASKQYVARIRFVMRNGRLGNVPSFEDDALLNESGEWIVPFAQTGGGAVIDETILVTALETRLGWGNKAELDVLAPARIVLPSGSSREINYMDGDIPVLAARLQEFFGCVDTPLVCGIPVMLHLLSPAQRPVQITRDLGGFWDRAYPEVKKELAGRYPRHYWPDNPREAEPTARAKPRK